MTPDHQGDASPTTASTATNLGVQIFGGHGYIREQGMEQLVRDGRITQIYEGANGIQALDLVGRKLPMHNGRLLRRFFHPVDALLEERTDKPELQEFVMPRGQGLRPAAAGDGAGGAEGPGRSRRGRRRGQRLSPRLRPRRHGLSCGRASPRSRSRRSTARRPLFYKGKLATARFFMARVLPETNALFANIAAGAKPLMELEAEAF